ncbi:hypothetical protein PV762_11710 [Mitsuaria sp. CC2]|uniref:hypothetical protein n=1 Tax=Mitsuaria sp. CC2 TaxID=3029186 RepID=UPI003B8B0FFA
MKPTDDMRWITTGEAAKISGLSRPLVEKILGHYPGEIRRSAVGAQPSVIADQFDSWIKAILAATDPGDLDQIRAEAILNPRPSAKAPSPQEMEARKASRRRAAELVKMLSNR